MIIPQHIIDEVRSQTDIVGVVSDYVRLKKRGSNFVGLCPFHTEKTPSFNVNPAREIYKCFGCGVGGDVFNFVSQTEGLSFPESVRLLADRAGITVPDEEIPDEEASETDAIYHALRFAARTFFHQITQSDDAAFARTYLEERGLTSDSVKKFGLGFASNGWDGLLAEAEKTHVSVESLENAGLVIKRKSGDGYYDRYRNRIIFPITSHVGKILGFGGRVLDPEDEPKYINSPETKVYDKSRVLYGLYQARNSIRKQEEALLVEGYTDVIALHQAGIGHAVATCGTAVTREQIKLIGRYANRITLLYDSDSAGIRAAFRAIDLILENGVGATAVALPDGQDPDSFVREVGSASFSAYLVQERQDIVHFILKHSENSGKTKTPEGQAGVQRTILRSISKIPDPLVRESYVKLASEVMDIPDLQLRRVLGDIEASENRRSGPRSVRYDTRRSSAPRFHTEGGGTGNTFSSDPVTTAMGTRSEDRPSADHPDLISSSDGILPAEKTLFMIMLRDGPPLIEFIMSNLALTDFSKGTSRELAGQIISMYENEAVSITGLVEGKYGDDLRRLSTEVLTLDIEPSENWSKKKNISVPDLNEEARESAISAMTLLKLERIDTAIQAQKERLYASQRNDEATRILAEEMMALNERRKMIKERKFIQRV